MASLIGDLTFLLWREGRRHAVANMRQVLGLGGDPSQARRLARQSLRNYCKTLADFLCLPRLNDEDIDRLVRFDRWDLFDRALAPGKGAIFATLHIGSWDLGGAAIARKGYGCSVLADVFRQAALNQKVMGTRQAKGFSIIPARGVPKAAVAALRKNHVLALLMDRPVAQGITIQFFGAPATLPAGAATLALRMGAAVLPGCLVRNADGTFTGLVDEPIFPSTTGRWEEDVRGLTQRIMTSLEAMIRRHPEQWYMFRPMWPGQSAPATRPYQEDREVALDRC